MKRLLCGCLADAIGPSVNDRFAVKAIEIVQDAALEFVLGSDPNMTEH
jgi:hypothetical protein